jgi:hypothetical protein
VLTAPAAGAPLDQRLAAYQTLAPASVVVSRSLHVPGFRAVNTGARRSLTGSEVGGLRYASGPPTVDSRGCLRPRIAEQRSNRGILEKELEPKPQNHPPTGLVLFQSSIFWLLGLRANDAGARSE